VQTCVSSCCRLSAPFTASVSMYVVLQRSTVEEFEENRACSNMGCESADKDNEEGERHQGATRWPHGACGDQPRVMRGRRHSHPQSHHFRVRFFITYPLRNPTFRMYCITIESSSLSSCIMKHVFDLHSDLGHRAKPREEADRWQELAAATCPISQRIGL
jgi:hypothetical protein